MVLCGFGKIISDVRSDFSNMMEGFLSEKFQLSVSKYFLTLSPMKTERLLNTSMLDFIV